MVVRAPLPPYRLLRVATCRAPLMPSLECAVVLTMSGNVERWARIRASGLMRLARVTYAQINPGWRTGAKPPWVTSSAHDLVHAYQSACVACDDVVGDVLLLEDDAEQMSDATEGDFALVDAFVRSHRPIAYTLGSVGLCTPHHLNKAHRHIGWLAGIAHSQAVVWSRRLREHLLLAPGGSIPHIDGHFLSRFTPLATYHRPLVAQRFPQTENMSTWSLFSARWLRPIDCACIGLWVRVLRALRLDRDVAHWHTLYAVQFYLPLYVGLLIALYATCTRCSGRHDAGLAPARAAIRASV